MDINREKALRDVMAADFTCLDLALYLNTHPYDMRALALYNNAVLRAKMLRENYERLYGPLTAQGTRRNMNAWEWVQTPWPWEWQ